MCHESLPLLSTKHYLSVPKGFRSILKWILQQWPSYQVSRAGTAPLTTPGASSGRFCSVWVMTWAIRFHQISVSRSALCVSNWFPRFHGNMINRAITADGAYTFCSSLRLHAVIKVWSSSAAKACSIALDGNHQELSTSNISTSSIYYIISIYIFCNSNYKLVSTLPDIKWMKSIQLPWNLLENLGWVLGCGSILNVRRSTWAHLRFVESRNM